MLQIQSHPFLEAVVFETQFDRPLSELNTPEHVMKLFSLTAEAPLATDDEVKKRVRDLLRQTGFKPTGRSKPASEYLIKAVTQEKISPINAAVDILNAVSFHSGLPISVVDRDLAEPPWTIKDAAAGESYVFNQSGQTIDIGNLLCLFDQQGPCANAVKDSQRTKTSPETTRTVSVIWGTNQLPGRTQKAFEWYRQLLSEIGASVQVLTPALEA